MVMEFIDGFRGRAVAYRVSERADESYQQKQEGWTVAYAALAILFQPFFKIALGRGVWNVVDVDIACLLLWTTWKEWNKKD